MNKFSPFALFAPLLLAAAAFAESNTNITHYSVRGVFKESRSGGQKGVIKHEAIPGYMDAMTMPFNVKDPAELKPLHLGDQISFRLNVTETDDWIDQIKRIATNAPALPAASEPETQFKELEPGAPVPDCSLTNQSGRAFRLAEFKGRALAFTFFFTRCPLPSYCPRMNSNLADVQRILAADSSKTNWQLLSISFDPDHDMPAMLAAYASFYHPDPAHWVFATGSLETIHQLGGAFGLMFWHDGGSISHNLRTVVVDASGRVRKVFTDNEWKPEELAKEIKQAMEAKS